MGTTSCVDDTSMSMSSSNNNTKDQSKGELLTVLPGDDLTSHIYNNNNNNNNKQDKDGNNINNNINNSNNNNNNKQAPKLGPGLSYNSNTKSITANLAGRLYHRPQTNSYYILSNSKRYIPQLNDRVLCIVDDKMGADYYKVLIPGSCVTYALLHSWMAFEGATKRNKPNLHTGSLIYARIHKCHIHVMEPEITCTVLSSSTNTTSANTTMDGGAVRKDWMTNESTYGELKGGCTMQVSLGLARELLKPNNVLLECLAKHKVSLSFEICIGVNGFIWVNATKPEWTILILNAIQNSEVMTDAQVRSMVKTLIDTVCDTMMDCDQD